MRINNNIPAMNAHRQLNFNNTQSAKNMEKLSSGFRINRAGDDAAGLAISEKMRGQIRGLNMASKNAQDGISLIQTAEGALNETHSILQRMRELAVQAGNDTNTEADRGEIQKEINQLTSEINRIGNTTEFNTQKLLNGDKTPGRDAVAATMTGTDISTLFNQKLDSTGTFTLNGQDITLTSVKALDGSTTAIDASKIAAALQTDIDAVFDGTEHDGVTFTVAADGNALKITSSVAGKDSAITVAGEGATTLGIAGSAVGADASAALQFQIGANQNQSMSLEIADLRAAELGIAVAVTDPTTADEKLKVTDGTSDSMTEQALDVSTHDTAARAITTIQTAIDTVSAERSKLGAVQNRLEHTINNLGTASENLQAAESRIRDVDMAKEMMTFTKNNILTQAAQAMLAQANQQPQGVLQLLR